MVNRPLELVIGRMMPQASDAGRGVQGLLFGLLGFGLAVVQSSLVFPVFSFGLGMLSCAVVWKASAREALECCQQILWAILKGLWKPRMQIAEA